MGDKQIKVTDKRMFTPVGELKDEYSFLAGKATAAGETPVTSEPSASETERGATPDDVASGAAGLGPGSSDPRRRREAPDPGPPPGRGAAAEMPPLELPGTPPGMGAPTFFDLAAILAEPVALYLGDMPLEDGQTAENLEMARLHIDLLDVLRQKTAGNLTAQEAAFLEDLLYRMRVRYVQKRG